ncbi:MAG: L-serine ammonia-lyase, iron-sulfur-dependent, subunit alpha [Ruminococcaceae bacterium]|nr:L-serine ammonia-lyase, iron-sulfur-dependent, subunit alpha [Oscillospiraceae bacterium]
MDFNTAEELLEICKKENKPISEIMRLREIIYGESNADEVDAKMKKSLEIMRASAHKPLTEVVKSIGGMIGGEASKLEKRRAEGLSICGNVLTKALIYSQAVLEVNASMGVIVAAPTAGSAGVLPAVLFSLEEEFALSEETLLKGLFTAGAIGCLLMKNASVSGAEAGCQAEIGSAAAMASAAAVEMMGGTPEQCFDAASITLSNMLGLVCDPIAGLVEMPCQSRNAAGASNALTSAEMALAGVKAAVPFTEMSDVMYRVGKGLPAELRETALGGCAATPTGCALKCKIFGGCS